MRIFIIGIGIFVAVLTILLLLIKAFQSEQQKQYFLVCALAIGLGAVGLCVLYSERAEENRTDLIKIEVKNGF